MSLSPACTCVSCPCHGEPDPAGGFGESRRWFAGTLSWLAGPAMGLEHGALEQELAERGREQCRLMLQDLLDARAAAEERLPVVAGSDRVSRTRAERGHARALGSLFGEVTVRRIAYRAPGAANLHPADAALNLPPDRHSHGVSRLNAIEAARGSFGAAGQAVGRVTGSVLGKRQSEEQARAAAADIDAFYASRRPGPSGKDVLLVMQFDGKGIVMRPGALRQATAKAAAASARKLATRLSPGEKNGRKRMAELAAVHDAVPVRREPEAIIGRPGKREPRRPAPGPRATGKWLTASVTDDIPAVIAAGFDEAERRDPRHERTWIALVDGNNTQIEAIKAEASRRKVTVTILIDFIHVLEYVWEAAWSFFETGNPAAEEWAAEQALKILRGQAARVAAGIRRRATTYEYSARERAGADKCAAYLTAKRRYLGYAAALEQGWPIATGIIEAARAYCGWKQQRF